MRLAQSCPGKVNRAERHVRKQFIFKVFLILAIQLIFMTVCVFVVSIQMKTTNDNFRAAHPYVLAIALGICAVLLFLMAFVSWISETFPVNLIFLCIFTLASTYLLSAIASEYNTWVVVHALALVAVIVLVLLMYVALPCMDFWFPVAGILAVSMVILVAIVVIVPNPRMQRLDWNEDWDWIRKTSTDRNQAMSAAGVYVALLGALVFSVYFVYDLYIQTTSMTEKEYIRAAFFLYADLALAIGLSLQTIGSWIKNVGTCSWTRMR